jgi:hypothetical protein
LRNGDNCNQAFTSEPSRECKTGFSTALATEEIRARTNCALLECFFMRDRERR